MQAFPLLNEIQRLVQQLKDATATMPAGDREVWQYQIAELESEFRELANVIVAKADAAHHPEPRQTSRQSSRNGAGPYIGPGLPGPAATPMRPTTHAAGPTPSTQYGRPPYTAHAVTPGGAGALPPHTMLTDQQRLMLQQKQQILLARHQQFMGHHGPAHGDARSTAASPGPSNVPHPQLGQHMGAGAEQHGQYANAQSSAPAPQAWGPSGPLSPQLQVQAQQQLVLQQAGHGGLHPALALARQRQLQMLQESAAALDAATGTHGEPSPGQLQSPAQQATASQPPAVVDAANRGGDDLFSGLMVADAAVVEHSAAAPAPAAEPALPAAAEVPARLPSPAPAPAAAASAPAGRIQHPVPVRTFRPAGHSVPHRMFAGSQERATAVGTASTMPLQEVAPHTHDDVVRPPSSTGQPSGTPLSVAERADAMQEHHVAARHALLQQQQQQQQQQELALTLQQQGSSLSMGAVQGQPDAAHTLVQQVPVSTGAPAEGYVFAGASDVPAMHQLPSQTVQPLQQEHAAVLAPMLAHMPSATAVSPFPAASAQSHGVQPQQVAVDPGSSAIQPPGGMAEPMHEQATQPGSSDAFGTSASADASGSASFRKKTSRVKLGYGNTEPNVAPGALQDATTVDIPGMGPSKYPWQQGRNPLGAPQPKVSEQQKELFGATAGGGPARGHSARWGPGHHHQGGGHAGLPRSGSGLIGQGGRGVPEAEPQAAALARNLSGGQRSAEPVHAASWHHGQHAAPQQPNEHQYLQQQQQQHLQQQQQHYLQQQQQHVLQQQALQHAQQQHLQEQQQQQQQQQQYHLQQQQQHHLQHQERSGAAAQMPGAPQYPGVPSQSPQLLAEPPHTAGQQPVQVQYHEQYHEQSNHVAQYPPIAGGAQLAGAAQGPYQHQHPASMQPFQSVPGSTAEAMQQQQRQWQQDALPTTAGSSTAAAPSPVSLVAAWATATQAAVATPSPQMHVPGPPVARQFTLPLTATLPSMPSSAGLGMAGAMATPVVLQPSAAHSLPGTGGLSAAAGSPFADTLLQHSGGDSELAHSLITKAAAHAAAAGRHQQLQRRISGSMSLSRPSSMGGVSPLLSTNSSIPMPVPYKGAAASTPLSTPMQLPAPVPAAHQAQPVRVLNATPAGALQQAPLISSAPPPQAAAQHPPAAVVAARAVPTASASASSAVLGGAAAAATPLVQLPSLESLPRLMDLDSFLNSFTGPVEVCQSAAQARVDEFVSQLDVVLGRVAEQQGAMQRRKRDALKALTDLAQGMARLEKQQAAAAEAEDFEAAAILDEQLAQVNSQTMQLRELVRGLDAGLAQAEAMRSQVAGQRAEAWALAAGYLGRLRAGQQSMMAVLAEQAEREVQAAAALHKAAEDALAQRRALLLERTNELREATQQVETHIAEATAPARDEQRQLEEAHAALEAEIANLRALLAAKEAQLASSDGALAGAARKIHDLAAAYDADLACLDQARSLLASEEQQVGSQEEQLRDSQLQAEARSAAFAEQQAALQTQAAALSGCAERLAARAAEARAQLDAERHAREARDVARRQHETAQEGLAALKGCVEDLTTELRALAEQRSTLDAERVQAVQRADVLQRALPELEAAKRAAATKKDFKEAARLAAEHKAAAGEAAAAAQQAAATGSALAMLQASEAAKAAELDDMRAMARDAERDAAEAHHRYVCLSLALNKAALEAAIAAERFEDANDLQADIAVEGAEMASLERQWGFAPVHFSGRGSPLHAMARLSVAAAPSHAAAPAATAFATAQQNAAHAAGLSAAPPAAGAVHVARDGAADAAGVLQQRGQAASALTSEPSGGSSVSATAPARSSASMRISGTSYYDARQVPGRRSLEWQQSTGAPPHVPLAHVAASRAGAAGPPAAAAPWQAVAATAPGVDVWRADDHAGAGHSQGVGVGVGAAAALAVLEPYQQRPEEQSLDLLEGLQLHEPGTHEAEDEVAEAEQRRQRRLQEDGPGGADHHEAVGRQWEVAAPGVYMLPDDASGPTTPPGAPVHTADEALDNDAGCTPAGDRSEAAVVAAAAVLRSPPPGSSVRASQSGSAGRGSGDGDGTGAGAQLRGAAMQWSADGSAVPELAGEMSTNPLYDDEAASEGPEAGAGADDGSVGGVAEGLRENPLYATNGVGPSETGERGGFGASLAAEL